MQRNCVQCGKTFELSQSEIDFYKQKNLSLPKRCKACREQNKRQQGATKTKQPVNPGKEKSSSVAKYPVLAAIIIFAMLVGTAVSGLFGEENAGTGLPGEIPAASVVQVMPETQTSSSTQSIAEPESSSSVQSVIETQTLTETQEAVATQATQESSVASENKNDEEKPSNVSESTKVAPEQSASPVAQEKAYRFRSKKLLNQHYEKHGIEMGFASAADYEAAASAVIQNPNALYKTEKEDGDGVYYVEETNEFAILSTDGYIRTYFNPSGGVDYFNRQ